jgi:hypothetical protein
MPMDLALQELQFGLYGRLLDLDGPDTEPYGSPPRSSDAPSGRPCSHKAGLMPKLPGSGADALQERG